MRCALMLMVACLSLGVMGVGATTVVRGKLIDATTGDPLAAATVQVLGTYEATISNPEGLFVLSVSSLPATVRFSHIGYQRNDMVIVKPAVDTLQVRLAPVLFILDEIVVTADMGAEIMRKVIAQKQIWRKRLESFEVDAYTRFVFKNHTGIVSIIESASEGYWDQDRGWREIIKARRQTSNMELHFVDAIPTASAVTNLYDDDVEIAGHHLSGVTHPDALEKYDFQVTGRRYLHDQMIYDISVKPRNKLVSGFEGQVSVLDSVFALVAVDLKPGQSFLFPPPVKGFSVAYRQQFRSIGDGVWLPVDFQFEAELDLGSIGLQFPPIHMEQMSRLSNYQLNTTMPDTLYATIDKVVVDSLALKSDSLLTRPGLAMPLSEIEQEAYARIDSAMTLEKAYSPTGFLSRFIKYRKEGQEDRREKQDEQKARGTKGEAKRSRSVSLDAKPDIWFNRVDGGHLGLSVDIGDKYSRNGLSGSGAYNTSLKRWAFTGELTGRSGKNQRGFASVRVFRGTDMRYRSALYNRFAVSSQQLFGAEDYFDYFWNEGMGVQVGYRFRRSRLTLSGGMNFEQHTSVAKTTDWHMSGDTDVQRPNPKIDDGDLRSVELRMEWKEEDNGPAPLFRQRKIRLEAEHSWWARDRDIGFIRFRGVIDWRFETLFRRRFLPNVLDVRLVGSTFTGTLPRQRYGILDAWLDGFSTFGAFRARLDRPYEGEKLLGVFWEHNFRTVPFEIVELRWLAERSIGVIVHGAHGRTWFSYATMSSLTYEPQYPDRTHHELGLSISGLFNLFRVDFTRRLDTPGNYFSLGMAQIF